MTKLKHKLALNIVAGIVDPISLIGVLLLVVTLIVGTAVTSNRKISLNISEKASGCFDECRKEKGRVYCNNQCGTNFNYAGEAIVDTSNIAPGSTGPTCDSDGKQYSVGSVVLYGGIGSYATCGSDGKWQVGVGSLNQVSPENVPSYAKETYNKAIAEQGSSPVVTAEQQISEPVATTMSEEDQRNKSLCLQDGGTWLNNSCSYKAQTEALTEVSKQIVQNVSAKTACEQSGKKWTSINTCVEPQKNTETTQAVTETNNGLGATGSITGLVSQETTPSIFLPQAKYSSKSECEQNTTPGSSDYSACGRYSSPEENRNALLGSLQSLIDKNVVLNAGKAALNPDSYSFCDGKSSGCNAAISALDAFVPDNYINYWQGQVAKSKPTDSLTDIAFNLQTTYDTAQAVSFNTFDDYVSAYSPDKVKIAWKEAGYDSAKSCQQDMLLKYGVPQAAASCNTYAPTKEQVSSSVKLGTILTLEGYAIGVAPQVIVNAAASGGLVSAGVTTLGQTQVVSTVFQAGNTASYCALNGWDESCKQQTARTGVSFATLGVSQYANVANNGLARAANTIVSGANAVVDTADVYVAYSDPNTDSLTKTMAVAGVLGDFGGFAADWKAGQIINSPYINVTSPSVLSNIPDIPKPAVETNDLKLALEAPVETTIKVPEGFVAGPKVTDVTGNVPKAVEVTIPEKVTSWITEKVTKPISNIILGKPSDISLTTTYKPHDINIPKNTEIVLKVDGPEVKLPDGTTHPLKVGDAFPGVEGSKVTIDNNGDYHLINPDGTVARLSDNRTVVTKVTNWINSLLPESAVDKLAYQRTLDSLLDTNPSKTDITNALLAEGYNPNKIDGSLLDKTTSEITKANNNSPKTLAINIAAETINSGGYTAPDTDLVGYQPGSARYAYTPAANIETAIRDVPDPLNLIADVNNAKSPEEALAVLIKKLEENGVTIVKDPLSEKYTNLVNQNGYSKSIYDEDQIFGNYEEVGYTRLNDNNGNEFNFKADGAQIDKYIFLHPEFDKLPIGNRLKTLLHETGHFAEQSVLPGKIENVNGLTGTIRPNTEYVSSLYGANGALVSAKFKGPQGAIDAGLIGQVELNSRVLGNPDGYIPKLESPAKTDINVPNGFVAGPKVSGNIPKTTNITIPEKIQTWFKNIFDQNSVDKVVKNVDGALTDAGFPNGANCRDALCEVSSRYVKADAENNGLIANDYNVVALNYQRGVDPENSLFHEFTIVTDKNGNRFLVDLTLGQFKEIDFTNPIAKAILDKGYIPLTSDNLTGYLNLAAKGNPPQVTLDILNKVNANPGSLDPTDISKYLAGEGVTIEYTPGNIIDENSFAGIYNNAHKTLIAKGYSEEQISLILEDSPFDTMLDLAANTPPAIVKVTTNNLQNNVAYQTYKPNNINIPKNTEIVLKVDGPEVKLPDGTTHPLKVGDAFPGVEGSKVTIDTNNNYHLVNPDGTVARLTDNRDVPKKFTDWVNNLLPESKVDKTVFQSVLGATTEANPSKTDIVNDLISNGYNPTKINKATISKIENEIVKIAEVHEGSTIYQPKIKNAFIEVLQKNGTLEGAKVEFDGRMYSAVYYKDSEAYKALKEVGGEEAVNRVINEIDSGIREANPNFIYSPKEYSSKKVHITYPDVTTNRGSSKAIIAKYLDGKATQTVAKIFAEYGLPAPKISDIVFVGLGPESKISFTIKGNAMSQSVSNPVPGALLGGAGPLVPPELRGGDYLPIIEYTNSPNPDISFRIEAKNITLTGNVLKKSDIGDIIPEPPSKVKPTYSELSAITSSVGFDSSLTPNQIRKLLSDSQKKLYGLERIDVEINDVVAGTTYLQVGNEKSVFAYGDVTPFSAAKSKIQEVTGALDSPEEIGFDSLINRTINDIAAAGMNHNGIVNKVAGDGADLAFLEGITPEGLRNLADLSNSTNIHIKNALNGAAGYTEDEKLAAQFIEKYLKDQIFVKVGAVKTDATLTIHPTNGGYTPTEFNTKISGDQYLSNSRDFKRKYGIDQTVVSISPDIADDFTAAELKQVGLKVINDPDYGTFLVINDVKPTFMENTIEGIKKFFLSPASEKSGSLNINKVAENSMTLINNTNQSITIPDQVASIGKSITDGSVPTGIGFSPFKYVTGGIVASVYLDKYLSLGIGDYIQNSIVQTISNINHVYADAESSQPPSSGKTYNIADSNSRSQSNTKLSNELVTSFRGCVNKDVLDNSIVGGSTGLRYDATFKPTVVMINDTISGAKYDMWTPAQVSPDAVEPIKEWVQWVNDQGYTPFISSGYRSYETQESYSHSYGNQAATAGGSCHQSGLCFDVHYYIDNKTGKRYEICQDPNIPVCALNLNAQKKAAELGIAHPYEWDQPHYFVAVAASPAILPFVQQQDINTTYIDQLNNELLNIKDKCSEQQKQENNSEFVSN